MTEYVENVKKNVKRGGWNFSKSQSLYRGGAQRFYRRGKPKASGKIKKYGENMSKYEEI